ncbi:MAG: hypothetical protein ACE5IH_08520 [Thermodesulfobacteriota bacterium]
MSFNVKIGKDAKKVKSWQGKVRILMNIDVEEEIIEIINIGFRGDIYK